ncbi:MAG: hypothetical protein GXY76_08785 [Chloroflexi bacterium]|nr:hypothetical protein [Chloroflexota bacterium]
MMTIISAFTKNGGQPATGLTLAEIDLYLTAVNEADGAETVIWNGTQHPASELAAVGMYVQQYANDDLGSYHYVAAAHYVGATVLDTGWVSGVLSACELADDAITAAKFDEATAFPQTSADAEAMVLP